MAARGASGRFLGLALCVLLVKFLGPSFVGWAFPEARTTRVMRHAEKESAADSGDRVSLKIMTPDGDALTQKVSEVVIPSTSGQLGVLANHAPMMTAVDTGVLRYKQGGKWKPIVIVGGFATVESNALTLLVNDMEEGSGIDAATAKSEMEEATTSLEKAESKKDRFDATQKVKKAAARLQAAMFQG